ncbi:hypothetical protein GpartN1_g1917.t1 [Galdieria partita]|uniref:DNA polymerase delta catalytic subunit n=1 Tax=Galdieria partita TaxID=83374 RepID=A0A9C7PUG3_9RHOD|nr:hypothetical protein GpartN1_g1917.t1 [Galdieria partita]
MSGGGGFVSFHERGNALYVYYGETQEFCVFREPPIAFIEKDKVDFQSLANSNIRVMGDEKRRVFEPKSVEKLFTVVTTKDRRPSRWMRENQRKLYLSHYTPLQHYFLYRSENDDKLQRFYEDCASYCRVLSFDIEVKAQSKCIFPDPCQEKSEVFMISAVCGNRKVLLCSNRVGQIEGGTIEVREFENEGTLLEGFCDCVRELDPDIITGYNICAFDLVFLQIRGKWWGVDVFSKMGRTAIIGCRELYFDNALEVDIPGRVVIDAYLKFRKELRASRCRLQDLSEIYLNSSKDDVTLEEIALAGEGKDMEVTAKVALYCVQDALLVLQLIEKLDAISSTFAMSRYTYTAPQTLYTRGVTNRIRNLTVHYGKNEYVFPPMDFMDDDDEDEEENPLERKKKNYEGAYVFAAPGVYDKVKAFDFNSLYPSIMIAMNICQSSFIQEEPAEEGMVDSVTVNEDCVRVQVKDKIYSFRRSPTALFPSIAKDLIATRKVLRQQGKQVDQNAVKIVTNSLYGALGAGGGFRPAAESVTSFGRYFIKKARDIAASQGWKVPYIDTDSIFVVGGPPDDLGEKISSEINEPPLRLQLDKTMEKLLVVKKKKYAMLKDNGRIVCSGMLNNRDDSCPLLREVELRCISAKFKDRSLPSFTIEDIQKRKLEDFAFKARFKSDVSRNSKYFFLFGRVKDIHVSTIEFVVLRNGGLSVSERFYPIQSARQEDVDFEYYLHCVEKLIESFS